MASDCNIETYVNYVMLAQDYFRDVSSLTNNSAKLARINDATEALENARRCGAPIGVLCHLWKQYLDEFIRIAGETLEKAA
jgi:hypothetical protein